MANKNTNFLRKAKPRAVLHANRASIEAPPSSQPDMQRLLDSIPAMLGYWDTNFVNIYSNNEYARYFKKKPPEIKGRHIKDLLGPSLYRKNLKFLKRALAGEAQTFEREIVSPSGVKRQTLASYVPDRSNNKVLGIFVIVTDISSVKELEARTRAVEARLIASAKMSSLGEMAAGIAHEVNNPLAIIYGSACQASRLLRHASVDQVKLRTLLKEIEETSMRIEAIIDGLRVFSREGSSDPFQKVSASAILNQTLDLCRARFLRYGVDVKIRKMRRDISLNCQSVPVSQILLNLLNNAFDAVVNTTKPIIQVEIVSLKNHVKFIVENSGKKIPPSVVHKIFEPFFTTKRPGEGTGLGLSISKGLAETQKGTLILDQESKRTKFVLCLPKRLVADQL